MTVVENRDIIINEVLIPSLNMLYKVDYFNIDNGVSERNICARLAHYMENVMRKGNRFYNYFADVEYNRKNDGTKKYYDNILKVPTPMVCDLIVHKRNTDPNLLAVEMKQYKNYNKRKGDRDRLKAIVSSPLLDERNTNSVYDTVLGAFIIYSSKKIMIEFYENMNSQGIQTGKMKLECIMEGNKFLYLKKTSENWIKCR